MGREKGLNTILEYKEVTGTIKHRRSLEVFLSAIRGKSSCLLHSVAKYSHLKQN